MSGETPPDLDARPGAALNGLFGSLGDFGVAVLKKDDRLRKVTEVRNAMSERVPADGGFLVPEEFRTDLVLSSIEWAYVRSRAPTVIPMRSLKSNVPTTDVTTDVGSILGGWTALWTSEGATLTDNNPGFGRVGLEAKKLMAFNTIDNELLSDADALNAFFRATLPPAIAYMEDDAFTQGSGQGEPKGAIYSPCAINVARTSVATPGATAVDVENMVTRMWPQGHKRAIWLCSPDVLASLVAIFTAIGTPTNVATGTTNWLDVDADGDWTILKHKLMVTEHVPALATGGDLCYIDFGAYVIGDRESMTMQISPHNKFGFDQSVVRVRSRTDGRMWPESPIIPANSSQTVSPVVVRAT